MKTKQNDLELAIAVKGEIISSNFEAFREYATAQIETISFDLKTDEDFEQASDDVKGLKKFEESLTTAKKNFLAQMDDVNQLLEQVDRLNDLSRATRLELDKRVRDQKNAVKEGIIRDGINALMVKNRDFERQIAEAIKGKSSLVKMQEVVLSAVEILNGSIERNRIRYEKASAEHGNAVAYGEAAFVCLTEAEAIIEIERRIERHRAALREAELKAERDRLQKDAAEREAATVKESLTVPSLSPTPRVEIEAFALRAEPTEAEELEWFIDEIIASFPRIKEARSSLKYDKNITKGKDFANAIRIAIEVLQS